MAESCGQVCGQVAPTSTTNETPKKIVIVNVDMGGKVPYSESGGAKKVEGVYGDFRTQFIQPIAKISDSLGTVSFDTGVWIHSQMNKMSGAKIRWWGGLTYQNPKLLNLYVAGRGYLGCMPSSDAGMVAGAAVAGINPTIVGPFKIDVYGFGVFREKYYNAPVQSASFYITGIEPNVTIGDLTLKLIAQGWYISTTTTPTETAPSSTSSTFHLQFGAGAKWKF